MIDTPLPSVPSGTLLLRFVPDPPVQNVDELALFSVDKPALHLYSRNGKHWDHSGEWPAVVRHLLAELERAKAQSQRHQTKWMEYEKQYILPCFDQAAAAGFDLKDLVANNAGTNCVMLLIAALRAELEREKASLDQVKDDREQLTLRLVESCEQLDRLRAGLREMRGTAFLCPLCHHSPCDDKCKLAALLKENRP